MAEKDPHNLEPKQEDAILALLNEPTVRKAAETAGVGERTLYRWLEDEVFSREYRKARRKMFQQAVSLTQKYLPMAVKALVKVIADPTAPHQAKVSAASQLMRFCRESIELDDVVERVEQLERSEAARKNNGSGA